MTLILLASLAPISEAAAPSGRTPAGLPSVAADPDLALVAAFTSAADEFSVPVELLYALGWEASHLNPAAQSAWGGSGMFDYVESDEVGGPSVERAAALIEVNPDLLYADWRVAARAAAALLADQAMENGGGRLPAVDDLDGWQGAVAAFSGRDEPAHQERFVAAIYEILADGLAETTSLGRVVMAPQRVEGPCGSAPPPSSPDSSEASSWVAACSSNYTTDNRGASDIDVIIIHTVQGSYSSCISWFQNCSAEVSAHYVVRSSDGDITQMVHEKDIGWHAGNWDYNVRSIGIEHEGYVDDCSYYTDTMYRASAALSADIAARQTVPIDRSHIIAHIEVPGSTHTDPGDCWDWDYYMELVSGESGEATGEIIGFVRDSDIYNEGGNLVGASVWIEETGDSTTVDGDGLYRFDGIPYGNYTIHASMSGYAEGTCDSALNASQDWCSIALFPGSDGGDDTDDGNPDDGSGDGGDDSGTDGVDTGPSEELPGGVPRPGKPMAMEEVDGACGCDSGAGLLGISGILGAVAALRRRVARG